jgi:Kef-type K+ transport system membrane component KefB
VALLRCERKSSDVTHLLQDIGIAVGAATALGLVAHWLKQPVILAFLIAGAVIGPGIGMGWVPTQDSVHVIGEIGLVLLLFVIGLEMDVPQVLASGRQLLVAGLGQYPLCVGLGLLSFPLLGFAWTAGHMDVLYLALVCGLSSTAIVVKLLADKAELDTLPGRLTLGVLVLQDVFAILVLGFQPNFAKPEVLPVIKALGASVLLLTVGWLMGRYVLGRVFASISRSPELVVAVSIGWCAFLAGGAGFIGLSKEMGALVAGLAISAFPYRLHVTAKTLPLRDFFLTLFFVALGMQITAPTWAMVGPVAAIVALTIASRLLTVWPLIAVAGGGHRTGVITAINLAQISEFGIVIASLGLTYGHIGQELVGQIIYAMAITAVLSSYAIRWNDRIFAWGAGWFRRGTQATGMFSGNAPAATCTNHPIVLLGLHRAGRACIDALIAANPAVKGRLLVIDFHLETLKALRAEGIAGHFGDIGSLDTLHHAHIEHARVLISPVPDLLLKGVDNRTLALNGRALSPHAFIIVTADGPEVVARLKEAGADEVISPWELAGARMAALATACA